uniref:methylated diphthine methylhydrolase n=1 Tax=Arcella intermedia TaxID=1963864 RepID=A0A6B2L9R2_9EUKA
MPLHCDSCEWMDGCLDWEGPSGVCMQYGTLAVGCYQLNEESKEREGFVFLYNFNNLKQFVLRQSLRIPGIFDMKWKDQYLGIASSTGSVDIYELQKDVTLKNITSFNQPDAQNCFTLSVSWNSNSEIAASYSTGRVSVLSFNEGSNELCTVWENDHSHSLESWIVSFLKSNPNIIISGADDCSLKLWDIRTNNLKPIASNSKSYTMGVTTIDSRLKYGENGFLVGSYDETVRYWDLRNMKDSIHTFNSGGGVWRIKGREESGSVAIAAMSGNFQVLQLNENKELERICSYSSVHSSLAYGIDWMPNTNTLASGSFYDNKLSVWSFQ